jgi:hypothetical protein
MQKVSRKGGNGDKRGKTPRGSGARVLAAADFATLFGVIEESCF